MLSEVEAKVKPVLDEFVAKMREQGYPERLIELGLKRAREYVQGMTRMLDSRHPELVSRAQIEILPEALSHSEEYIRGLAGLVAPRVAKIYGMKYWEEKVKEVLGKKEGTVSEVVG
jgi:hypothetical protein